MNLCVCVGGDSVNRERIENFFGTNAFVCSLLSFGGLQGFRPNLN